MLLKISYWQAEVPMKFPPDVVGPALVVVVATRPLILDLPGELRVCLEGI